MVGMKIGTWLEAREAPVPATAVTRRFHIFNADNGSYVGFIRWYTPWRKYGFFPPESGPAAAVFEEVCLRDIADFLEKLTAERKESRAHPA